MGEGCSEESGQHLQRHCGSTSLVFRGCSVSPSVPVQVEEGPVFRWTSNGSACLPGSPGRLPPCTVGLSEAAQFLVGPFGDPQPSSGFFPEFQNKDTSQHLFSQGGRKQ